MQKIIHCLSCIKRARMLQPCRGLRRTLLIMAVALFSIQCFAQQELEKKIDVSFRNTSLQKALLVLQEKSGLSIAYNNALIPKDSKVNYAASRKQVKEVLAEILKPYQLGYELTDGFIRIRKQQASVNTGIARNITLSSNTRDISGAVKDSSGRIMAGVTVSVKEKPAVGTTTDLNGRFILSVPENATLSFTSVGFRTVEESVAGRNEIDIVLHPQQAGLDEVVVVGFGEQKKISLVGAQSTVNVKSLQVPAANLTNVLAGRVSGVIGVQRTGEPGFDDADIWIRGISTFEASLSAPLVLVDGSPRLMANVDPEDIESFTILKDASATAVYGVRGANGVILIKTKSGKAGKPQFSVRYYEGRTAFTKKPEFADGITYMKMSNEALINRGAAPIYSDERIRLTEENADPYLYPNVDWMKEVFKSNGYQRKGNVNINGGSDRVTYYVSTAYFDEAGLYRQDALSTYNQNTGYKRYNLTSNLSVKASNLTKIELGIQGYLANANYPFVGQADIFKNIWVATPVLHPVKYENGEMADQRSGGIINPYANLTQKGYANQWRNQLYSNLRATQELPFITKGLSLTGMFAFDVYNYTSMRREKTPDTYLATGRDAEGNMQYEQTRVGERFLKFNRNSIGERTIYLESALNYNRSFGKHDVTGMALFNQSDKLNSQANDLETSLPYRYLGISGRTTYGFDNRYLLELNFGYNGSENFNPARRYGFFPSAAIGWVISREAFFGHLRHHIPMAKIRFSHGKVGNANIISGSSGRRFAYLSTVASTKGFLFGQGANVTLPGYNIGEYGVDVTWETAVKTNLGIDVSTSGNTLNVQLDAFKERREGIFLRRGNVPAYVGLQNAPYGNLGIIENKGLDGSFTFTRRFNKKFMIQLLGNFTLTRNKVIENDQPKPIYPWLDSRGRKVNQRFGLVALGLFESEDEIAHGPLHPGTVKPGDIKFQDFNGDGKIDDFDRVPIGRGVVPELVYGFGFTVNYKAFTLSTLFQGVGNVDIFMNGDGVMPFSVSMSQGNLLSNIEDRWTVDNPSQDVFYPRLSDGKPNANYNSSTWWIKNGRYLRLKNMQLSYNLPAKTMERIGLKSASVFFSGFNLLTWSPFKFWDVELGDGRGTSYPNISTYALGFSLNF